MASGTRAHIAADADVEGAATGRSEERREVTRSCRKLTLTLEDGTAHTALFRFRP
jgi:hypothetical protein